MNCDCIKMVDDKLAEENLALDTTIIFSNPVTVTLSLSTHWKDSDKKPRGKKPKTIIVNFCPFCGKSAERKAKAGARNG